MMTPMKVHGLAGAICCAWIATSPMRADVVTAQWVNNTTFFYEITHMPDLDQRRMAAPGIPGLPSNGGMYCVPTSTVNMMAYAANHGFAALPPGQGNWQLQANYNDATSAILTMGMLMNTDPINGTDGNGWINGAQGWIGISGFGSMLNAQAHYPAGLLGPTLNLLAQKGIQGSLVSLAYGRYERTGTFNGFPLFKRVGGHIVTLAKAERTGQTQKMWVRDPADDAADSSQSPFVNRYWDVDNVVVYVQGNPHVQRVFSALDYVVPAVGEKVRFIDGAVSMRPTLGYSFINTGGIWTIILTQPFVLEGFNQISSEIALSAAGGVLDGIVIGDATAALTLQETPGVPPRLHRTDLITGESAPLSELAGADQIATSPKPAVYVMSEEQLQCVDLTLEVPAIVTIPLPAPGDALTYDQVHDEVVVLSIPDRKLLRYRSLDEAPITMAVPNSIPLKGMAKMTIDPTTGLYWFVSQATHLLYGFNLDAAGAPIIDQASLPDMQQPISVDFDDLGHMYVSHADGVTELRKAGAVAGWIVVPDSPFAKAPPGSPFRITKSENNFDPTMHLGPEWNNIDPEELSFGLLVPDCDGDVTHNGVVDVDDLLMIVNGWGDCPIGPCAADATGNRVIDVDDLLTTINGWGDCP